MEKLDKIVSALSPLFDAYMTEAGRSDIGPVDLAVALAKAATVVECIELIESMTETN